MFFYSIRKIWNPAMYQGKTSMKGYFEGWYYKLADKNESHICALIPGVSFDKEGRNPQAFIQFLSNTGTSSQYFSFDIGRFSYSRNTPEIRIDGNSFSPSRINIDIAQNSTRIKGIVAFKNTKPWPVSLFSPGAMGWYAFVPLMECYHGVLSFDHLLEGQLGINGDTIDFCGGRGYIEKDWGRSFPSYHIWVQTNHFDQAGVSLMVSIANVPWLGKAFDGFLIGFWYEGRLYRFTTYSGAKIRLFEYDQKKLQVHVQSKSHLLEIEVSYIRGALLRTPVVGEMQGRLSESLTAKTRIRFFRQSSGALSLVFEGTGRHSGLEIEGKIPLKLNQ